MTGTRAPEIPARVMSLPRGQAEDRRPTASAFASTTPVLAGFDRRLALSCGRRWTELQECTRVCTLKRACAWTCLVSRCFRMGTFRRPRYRPRTESNTQFPLAQSRRREIVGEAAYRSRDKICNEKKDSPMNSGRETRNVRKKRTTYPMTGVIFPRGDAESAETGVQSEFHSTSLSSPANIACGARNGGKGIQRKRRQGYGQNVLSLHSGSPSLAFATTRMLAGDDSGAWAPSCVICRSCHF